MEKINYFFKEFLPAVSAEWKKVTKPSWLEVKQTTVVVIVTSVVFAIFLWLADTVIQYAYKGLNTLLGL
jgi:preprotein translocase SecE subunit